MVLFFIGCLLSNAISLCGVFADSIESAPIDVGEGIAGSSVDLVCQGR